MKRKKSIRTELILLCTGLILVSMVCQIGFNALFGRSLSIAQKERQIQDLYTNLIQNYTDDVEVLSEIMGDAHDIDNIKVHIMGENGDIIYAGDSPMRANVPVMLPREGTPLNLRDLPPDRAPEVDTNPETVVLTESFTYDGEVRTVEIWSSVEAINGAVNLFANVNVIVSFVLVLCSIGVVVFFSKRIIRPVVEIETVAKNVARLDFSTTANESVHAREFSSLAKSINTMSQELASMIDKLSEENANLATKVEYQEQMERMRRQFVANISHEMKTPLSMLMMYSESLQLNVEGIDKDYYCATIMEEAAGLNDMVGQLLDISAIENGLSQVVCVPMDFSRFCKNAVEKARVLLSDCQVSIDLEEDVWVDGDGHYLERAIRNYLTNAVSHTEPGGQVTIELVTVGNKVRFSVKNQGNPIAKEDIPHLWESFYRGDKSRTKTTQKRVGLGLYLVKTCIQAHHGTVGVQNRADGVEFSFTLPTVDAVYEP